MKIKFYVINHDEQTYKCFLVEKTEGNSYFLDRISKKTPSPKFTINSYCFHLFLNEINCCECYRLSLARFIKDSRPYVIKIIPPKKEYIDKTWGEIVRILVWEQLEIDHMFSWLSTLGGAFSALGDYFEDRAEIAGKISIQQMKLAIRLGDPNLISRCKLFLSISLMQLNKLKMAQLIIRQQYEYAKSVNDTRLVKMCLGIWSKLQYTHKVNRDKHRLNKIRKSL